MNTLIKHYKNKVTGSIVEAIQLIYDKDHISTAIEWVDNVDMPTSYFGEVACVDAVRRSGKLKLNVDKDPSLQYYAHLDQYIIRDKEGLFHALDQNVFLLEYKEYNEELDIPSIAASLSPQFPIVKILQELNKIEQEKDITILFAIESGSRAWGYDSPDSDFDIKFVYVPKSLEATLSIALQPKPDVISRKTDDDLMEISGWRLDKFLTLLSKSNTSPLEWIKSPIVYKDKYSLIDRLNSDITKFFDQRHVGWQYYRAAVDVYDKDIRSVAQPPSVKCYIQTIRFLLSGYYALNFNTPIKPGIENLLNPISLDNEFVEQVNKLIELKRSGKKCDAAIRRYFDIFIDDKSEALELRLLQLPKQDREYDKELITELYLEILRKVYDL